MSIKRDVSNDIIDSLSQQKRPLCEISQKEQDLSFRYEILDDSLLNIMMKRA
jgi:hypothetical protein